MRNGLLGTIVGLALVAAACGGGNEQQDASVQDDAGPPQFDRQVTDQAVQDDAQVNDNNNSFAEAVEMSFATGGNQKTGVVNPAGDQDYYKFTGTAGSWVGIWISANAECSTDKLDPVVTLYDSTETMIAQNDDEIQGVNCDSYLITRLPEAGTYYMTVQDWYKFKYPTDSSKWKGGPLYTYKIYLIELQNGVNGTTIDQEPGNDLGTAAPVAFPSGQAGTLLGAFANASDVDVYTFTLAADATVYFTFQSPGTSGNGSTAALGNVWLTDGTDATVVARIDGAAGANELQPPLIPAGSYALWVTASGALGTNPFYSASNYTGTTDNPLDTEGATNTGMNDDAANAQALTESSTVGSYYVLSHLPTLGDVDYYKVDLAANTTFAVACGAARNVRGGLRRGAQRLGRPGPHRLDPRSRRRRAAQRCGDRDGGSRRGRRLHLRQPAQHQHGRHLLREAEQDRPGQRRRGQLDPLRHPLPRPAVVPPPPLTRPTPAAAPPPRPLYRR
jgi:hypothetical protein